MDIWEFDKLVLFIAFVIPGFISIRVYDLFIASGRRESSKLIVDAIGFSCINYALFSWAIYLVNKYDVYDKYPIGFALFLIGILFIFPALLALTLIRLRKMKIFYKHSPHPVPKAWDYVFERKESYWVVIYLTDGTKIGGMYDTDSFASSYPEEEQIYIQEVWDINEHNKFIKKRNGSCGALISAKDIKTIEFIGG